jgi:flavin-dependent dehydrogenase
MRRCDVLVVGGGPAGAACAGRLTQAGADVVVVDRAVFPRPKVCAGWVTPEVWRSLDVDLDEYARGRVLQPITAFRTGLVGQPAIETRYDEPISYGIRRYELDQFLLARSGATLATGAAVASIERAGDGWVVNGAFTAPMLVGAGGHFCPVARLLGGGGSREPVVAAQEIELPLGAADREACRVSAEVPELYFTPDLAGYGWCFRKGGYLNVGFGRQGGHGFAAEARAFIEWLRGEGRVPESALRRWQGHAYLLYKDRVRTRVADGALLVGDAAGLAYAQSGEGIRTAVESGLLAADAILAAAGDYRGAALAPYAQALVARFGTPGPSLAARLLPSSWIAALGGRLMASPWLTRHVLLDRHFLHRTQPALQLPSPIPAKAAADDINIGRAQGQDPGRPRPDGASLGVR